MNIFRILSYLKRHVLFFKKPGLFVRGFVAVFVVMWIFTYFRDDENKGEIVIEREYFQRKEQNQGRLSDFAVYDTPTLLLHRKILVNTICQKRKNISGKVEEITGYKKGGISYCLVQKAGCTSWSKIFRFLNGDKSFKKTPMNISKYETHYTKMKNLKFFHQDNEKDKLFIKKSTRVMTARDPYSRLWSAYIDKFLLPDFWITKGKTILKMVRKNASVDALRCGSDVTFPEFISYVVIAGGGDVKSLGQDKHWLPASSICDPCIFKPKFIAKQETFSKDMEFILKSINLNWVLRGTSSIDKTEHELVDQTDYVFNIYKDHKSCVTMLQLCQLMWKAYRFNGYIPYDAPFPENELTEPINKDKFVKLLLGTSRNWTIDKADRRKLKRQIMVEAFKTVSHEHLKKLQDIYSADFSLFDYDKEPKDIFS